VEYKKTNGDCNVRQHLSEHVELSQWVAFQRRQKNTARMTEEREAKLDSIGFDSTAKKCTPDWDLRFRQLLEYKQEFGDCNVVSRNKKLSGWVTTQRTSNKKEKMTKEHWEKLNSIGLKWTTHLRSADNKYWDFHFRDLLAYLQTHGDCDVPRSYPRNPLLAIWVSQQRNGYDLKRRGDQTSLTPLREAKLDAIGFPWSAGGNTKEDAPAAEGVSSAVRPEVVRSESKVRSKQNGVASPDGSITSG
jgi:hypothetical protein